MAQCAGQAHTVHGNSQQRNERESR